MGKVTDKKIGVLMGGLSSERDISMKTGTLIALSLKRQGYKVVTIDAGRNLPLQILEKGIEVAFIALHGRYGEDGCVQGLLEVMGIPYTGSGVAASAICMDKILSKKIFDYHEIPAPACRVYRIGQDIPGDMAYPVVVKPAREGSTIGISIVEKEEDLPQALERAGKYDNTILLEEYIDGMEVTAGILADRPLPLIEISPPGGFYDYEAKTTKGLSEYIVPARLSPDLMARIQDIALMAHKAVGCHYLSRVDFRIDKGGNPYVLEVNTIPGMTETSLLPRAAKEAGISYDELVETILNSAFTR